MNGVVNVVKLASSIVIGTGAGTLVGNGVNILLKDETRKVARACAVVTGVVVGGIVADKIDQEVDRKIDGAVETGKKWFGKRKKKEEEVPKVIVGEVA